MILNSDFLRKVPLSGTNRAIYLPRCANKIQNTAQTIGFCTKYCTVHVYVVNQIK
jgi:hypothetical protein